MYLAYGATSQICSSTPLRLTLITDPPDESRSLALKHYLQNEKSLKRKSRWTEFEEAVQGYGRLGPAELVPPNAPSKNPNAMFYSPMHGVIKESSTTTKLGVMFNALAKSATGISLNDTLLPGPSI